MSYRLLATSLLGLSAAFITGMGITGTASAETYKATSPNGRVQIAVEQGAKGLSYSVSLDGQPVISPSPLELNLDIGRIGGGGNTVLNHTETSVNMTYDIVVGKAKSAPDHYNQTEIDLQNTGQTGLKFNLIIRAYDNGAALRYAIPAQAGVTDFKVMSENTQFNFPADYDCWGAIIGRFDSSFEAEYDPIKASKIRNFHNVMDPLVCKTGTGLTTFAIAESDVKAYPGFYLSGRGDGGLGVMTTLPPRFDNDRDYRFRKTVVAKETLTAEGFKTPWRVIMIGDTPGDLTASSLIPTLAAPSVIADTSWIKPGKTSWDWWNDWAVNVPHPGINTESYKAFVDFSHDMKLEDVLIDCGWSIGSTEEPNPDADVTRAIPAIDMPELLAYAKSKNVGIWLWVQSSQLNHQMDAALDTYEKWGIKGIKVDFMNRNDQEMVDWYHTLLTKAAAHHLMVDLHGAYPPNGLNRTYPNYVTQEGVLGAENNKWSARITATHNVTLPFTRMILGPMDYTPGGFHNTTPADFKSRNREPFVMTTRGQAIAMYVVYDSPLQMVSDSPAAYKNADGTWADGAEFVSAVPASWDETRVLAGDIGQYIVTARRKGDTWYIGAMTNEAGRTVDVPLSFLGDNAATAQVWQDGEDASHLIQTTKFVSSKDTLTLTLAPSGGAVAVLSNGLQGPDRKPVLKKKK